MATNLIKSLAGRARTVARRVYGTGLAIKAARDAAKAKAKPKKGKGRAASHPPRLRHPRGGKGGVLTTLKRSRKKTI